MRMKFLKSLTAAALSAFMLNPSFVGFSDPALFTASAKEQIISGMDGEYTYELFNADETGKTEMYQNNNGGFNCEWNSVSSADFKKGFVYDMPIGCDSINKLDLSYECEFMPVGNALFGINGNFSGDNADFFIVEGNGNWELPENAEFKHTVEINGKKYDIYTSEKSGKFTYWSVAENSSVKPSKLTYLKNAISFTDHLNAWELAGLDLKNSALDDLFLCIHSDSGSGTAFVNEFKVTEKNFTQSIAPSPVSKPSTTTATISTATATTVSTTVSAESGDYLESGKVNGFNYKLWNNGNAGDVRFTNQPDNGFHSAWSKIRHSRAFKGYTFDDSRTISELRDTVVQYSGEVNLEAESFYGVFGRFNTGEFFEIAEGWGSWELFRKAEWVAAYTSNGRDYDLYKRVFDEYYDYDGNLLENQTVYYCVSANDRYGSNYPSSLGNMTLLLDHLDVMKRNGVKADKVSELYFGAESFNNATGYIDINTLYIGDCDVDGPVEGGPSVTVDKFPMEKLKQTSSTLLDIKEYDENGYLYSIWNDSEMGAVGYENNENGGFKCAWAGIRDTLFTKGVKFNDLTSVSKHKTLNISYDVDFLPEGNAFIGAYGWMKDPMIEFYIVDAWGDWKPRGFGQPITSFVSNGVEYDVYRDYIGWGDLIDTGGMLRYWSVRKINPAEVNKTVNIKGDINLMDHFKAWEQLGLEMGKLSEASFFVQPFESSGMADVHKLSIDCGNDYTPVPTVELPENYICNENFDRSCFAFKPESYQTIDFVKKHGSFCLESRSGSTGNAGVYYVVPDGSMKPGEGYKLTFKCYSDDKSYSNVTVKLRSGNFDPHFKQMEYSYTTLADISVSSGEWNEVSCPLFIVPEDSQSDLRIYIESDSAESICIDDFAIIKAEAKAEISSADDDKSSFGDLNGDGQINVFDVLICRSEFCNMLDGKEYDTSIDINRDGRFTVSDLILISGYVSGKYIDLNGNTGLVGYVFKKEVDMYGFEVWNAEMQGIAELEPLSSGRFTSKWDGVKDCIFTTKIYGNDKKYPIVTYSAEMGMYGDAYYGCYGWLDLGKTVSEVYVVDGWTGAKPFEGEEPVSSFYSNNKLYNVYRIKMIDSPTILGNEETYYQYWSVADVSDVEASDYCQATGKIDLKDHVDAWNDAFDDADLKLGSKFGFDFFVEAKNYSSGYLNLLRHYTDFMYN